MTDRQLFRCRVDGFAAAFALIVVVFAASGPVCADSPATWFNAPPLPRPEGSVDGLVRSPRTPAPAPPEPSDPALQLVARSCETHVQKGVDLAKRGAIYSAQNEFFVRCCQLVSRVTN